MTIKTMNDSEIVKDAKWEIAWKIINETDTNMFLTGKAGTGKTTFLRFLKEHTNKRLVVLAPTGIAAINARGVTIHSFFQLPFSPFIPGTHVSNQQRYKFSKEKLRIIRGADLIVIDEVSMVRADLLDAIDDALRKFRRSDEPFGGVQLLLIGDMQQLSPVVKNEEWNMLSLYYDSPYFFDSIALKKSDYATIEFQKVFRQDDNEFISILNKIRENNIDDKTLSILNSRYVKDYTVDKNNKFIWLTTHNASAQSINEKELASLSGKPFNYIAKTDGTFPEYSYPTDKILTVKLGTQVMFVKNDTSADKLYYNGMIGEICAINENGFSVKTNETHSIIEVKPTTWQNCKYKINDETKEIEEEIEGTFTQFPVKTAWAITIHKSQGLTFSHAIIDVAASFAHGQTYVALSRCKTLEGLILSSPVTRRTLISDSRIDAFTRDTAHRTPSDNDIKRMHRQYTERLVSDLFDFTSIEIAIKNMTRVLDEHLYMIYPLLLKEYKETVADFIKNTIDVALKFKQQYKRLISEDNNATDTELQDRINKGATYFLKQISKISQLFAKTNIASDNKQISKQITNAQETLAEALNMKSGLLEQASKEKFSPESYLTWKAAILLGKESQRKTREKKTTEKDAGKLEVPSDILHPRLLNELTAWRREKVKKEGLPAYCILSQKAVIGIANLLPSSMEKLMLIPYIGKAKADKYGKEILKIVEKYNNTISSTNQDP